MVSGVLANAFGGLTAYGIELAFAGSVLLAIYWMRGDSPQLYAHPARYYLICGGCWIANAAFFWAAVGNLRDSQQLVVVGLINYLWPSFTLLGAVVVLKRAWRWPLVPGLLLAFVGIVIVRLTVVESSIWELVRQLQQEPNLLAYSFAFLDAVAWGLYSNYSRTLAKPGAVGAVPLFMLSASLPLFVLGRLSGEVIVAEPRHMLLLGTWALLSAGAYVLWDWGMRIGRVVAISSFSMGIPLLSTVFTAVANGVPLSGGLIFGAVAVVAGAAICRRAVSDTVA